MNITKETIIGELVAQDYRTASVFKNSKIDFCCNGNRTIEEACDKKNIDSEALIAELENVAHQTTETSIDYNAWPLDLLADYIEKKHHRYVHTRIIEITPFLEKVVRVHGDRHPELAEVEQLFKASAEELTQHMFKEEKVLFPFVRNMIQEQSNGHVAQPPFGTIQNPIAVMLQEHDNEGERFRKIAELTNNYTPPADACRTYSVTFSLLKEFEDDLHLHIHLENNILFPKAIELEEKLATA